MHERFRASSSITGAQCVSEQSQEVSRTCARSVEQRLGYEVDKYEIGSLRKDESVAIDPIGVLGIVCHDAVEQDVGGRSQSPRKRSSTTMDPADQAGETYIGAPGWPELALKVASTCTAGKESALGALRWGEKPALRFGLRMAGQQTTAGRWGEGKPEGSGTHGQESNCVDGQLVKVGVGHDGREGELGTIEREKFQKL